LTVAELKLIGAFIFSLCVPIQIIRSCSWFRKVRRIHVQRSIFNYKHGERQVVPVQRPSFIVWVQSICRTRQD